ncbi:MAG: hypothetical protein DRP65_00480 [Planctomycetota bacterium]|nr:MAG: hypothetical protein DRP65_00480 [Planctomycetota bacterium]
MNGADPVKIKQARRLILRNLDLVYPSGLTMRSLYQTVCAVDPMYDFSLFGKDIEYLKAKGYLFFVDDALGGADKFTDKVGKLTAAGIEVAQRITTDEALDI